MTDPSKVRHNRRWAILVGTGLALSPIHNLWLTLLTTNASGETLFFLPAFGYLMMIMGVGLFLLNNWEQVKATSWSDRGVVIPLLVIVGAIGLSGITVDTWPGKLAPLGMGATLFGLYLMARVVGKNIFLPLAVGAVIASLGVFLYAILHPGVISGGFVFEDNYDIVVGYVLLGAALFIHKWQWLLAGLALVAILLTGSPEGLFVLGVLGVVVLARRDWGRRLVIVAATVLIIIVLSLVSRHGQTLYSYAGKIAGGETASPYGERGTPVKAIDYRIQVAVDAMSRIKLLGEGYNLTNFSKSPNVHNVPLVIVQQLGWPGILAGLAWLWVSIRCWVKTKWKYTWILIMSLAVWDHYLWTQLAPWWWTIIGVTTATNNFSTDLIFRQKKETEGGLTNRQGV